MATGGETEAYGVLRIDIAGRWSAGEMADLFGTLDAAYRAAATVRALSPRGMGRFWVPTGLDDYVEGLVQTGRAAYGDLGVHAMRHESPGWIEVFGALNPLNVIERFVTSWRSERSQRDRDRAEDERARAGAALAERQAERAFALEVLDRLEPGSPAREELVARLVRLWPERPLARLAADARVTELALQPVRATTT
jgi:hypothetical protein